MRDDLVDRLERTAAERARSEPFADKTNYLNVYARLSREDGELMAEAAAELAAGEVSPELITRLARASMRACAAYYDGTTRPSLDPLETHRVIVRAILVALGDKRPSSP